MKFKEYWGKQFGNPTGLGGKIATSIMNCINKPMYKVIEKEIKNGAKILDIGFGNGCMLKKLLKKTNSKFYGIDISKDMVKTAHKKNKKWIKRCRLKLSEASVEHIPFDQSFDQIYTINTIYFWDNLETGLEQIFKKLNVGGELFVVCYTKQWLDKRGRFAQDYKKYQDSQLLEILNDIGFKSELIPIKAGTSFYIKAMK